MRSEEYGLQYGIAVVRRVTATALYGEHSGRHWRLSMAAYRGAEWENEDWEEPVDRDEPTSDEDHEDIAEQGICEVCGRPYRKNTSESNLSRTGQCLNCGWNP